MIVCSCNAISALDVERAVAWMRAADGDAVITPGTVFQALGKRPACGGCLPLFEQLIQQRAGGGLPGQSRRQRRSTRREENHEGRPEGHRLPESRAEA
ncbi:MAG: (2Fe-2S)-binding protein [Proteobacteria bacterium]|nr:(2Fe-2S)-binding protein [Pseudomonadota bacterium]